MNIEKENLIAYDFQMKSIDRQTTTIEGRLNAFNQRKWGFDSIIRIDEYSKIDSLTFSQRIAFDFEDTLEKYYEMKFGVKLYQVGKGKPPQKKSHSEEKLFESKSKVNDNYYPLIRARDVQRFQLLQTDTWINYGAHLAEPRNITLFEGYLSKELYQKNILML